MRAQTYDTTQRNRLDEAEVAQAFHGSQRIVVELAVVVDAAHAGPHQEILVGQDLVPERLDFGHLGEEAVAADVEAPAVALDGPADPPDHVVGFQDGGVDDAEAGELVRRCEPCRPGTDDDDLLVIHGESSHGKRKCPSGQGAGPRPARRRPEGRRPPAPADGRARSGSPTRSRAPDGRSRPGRG